MGENIVASTADRRWRVLRDIDAERIAQLEKWGDQRHPDGTADNRVTRLLADLARARCESAAAQGEVTWMNIAEEELFEAAAEDDLAKLREELVQAAAVLVAWIEDIDSRTPRAPDAAPEPATGGVRTVGGALLKDPKAGPPGLVFPPRTPAADAMRDAVREGFPRLAAAVEAVAREAKGAESDG